MLHCWSCGKATGIVGRPARTDDCPQCRKELRSCRGCRYYDASKSSQCAESRAEVPVDKDKVNFCEYFVAGEYEQIGKSVPIHRPNNINDAKAAFDSLFK